MRIAHLSDVHTLEPRRAAYGWGVQFVSLGRTLDASGRLHKLERALDAAKRSGADHYVISGDLTEMGTEEQFEAFASVLVASGIDPVAVTLVPGNHDLYTEANAWQKALRGPLRAFAHASADAPGKVVDRGDLVLLPLDLTIYQSVARSGGHLTGDAETALAQRLDDPAFRDKALVIVQHHPPFERPRLLQWVDGLRNATRLMDLLAKSPRCHLLHGHLHHIVDRIIGLGKHRVFGAPAVVDDKEDRARVRIYDVRNGALESVGLTV